HRPALPRAPRALPGRRAPDERRQGAPRARGLRGRHPRLRGRARGRRRRRRALPVGDGPLRLAHGAPGRGGAPPRRVRALVTGAGARVVLDAAARAPGRPRVVHTSSCATCGPVRDRAATEDDAPPAWELAIPYKGTKVAGERLALQAAAEGHDVVVVNPTTP